MTSLKAKALQNEIPDQFNIISAKKKRNKRKILVPLTDQKSDLRKTDSNFQAVSPMRYQQKLDPIEMTNKQEEEMCECGDQVANDQDPQISQEFKMTIVTKKKSVIKRDAARMVCEHCGGTIPSALHGSYSLSTVKNLTQTTSKADEVHKI